MNNITEVTAQTFEEEVLDSPIPVLVDLYATWCPPCRVMGQILHQVAPSLEGRVKIVKINTDHEPELAGAFQVQSIPTIALISDGKVVAMNVGVTSAEQLQRWADQFAPIAARK